MKQHMYISGVITSKGNMADNINKFMVKEDEFKDSCYVYNPARLHMSTWTQEQYMDYYLRCILPTCDAIYMLQGWEHSKGACLEHEYAIEHGLVIIYE